MKMTQIHYFIVFLLATIIFMHTLSPSHAQPVDYTAHVCMDIGTFSNASAFQRNLNRSLGVLYANSANSSGFYSSTVGKSRNVVHTLFLCRGDITPEVCQTCIKYTIEDLTNQCPNQRGATIWYSVCMLRWSNRTILGTLALDPLLTQSNHFLVDDLNNFQPRLTDFMNGLVRNALASNKYFADGVWNTNNANGQVFGLVQCTPDISKDDCKTCLDITVNNIPLCCIARRGGKVMTPSCSIRFELYSFFDYVAPNVTAPAPSPEIISALPPEASPNIITTERRKKSLKTTTIAAIVVPSVAILGLLILLTFFYYKRSKKAKTANVATKEGISTSESLQYDLGFIEASTNNFSSHNKIGEGRFGIVYKGELLDRQEIAVKRLADSGGKSVDEFKSEVALVAKLQHRNLVKLLGFCIQGVEKLLIYEFVPNKSLDYFLFDPSRGRLLNWPKRQKIVEGIARGLLYLHEDSRLKVVHRDLKPSNVLLDEDMNPKISDFGMARIFDIDHMQKVTNKIVGTTSYMSPEYAMLGQYSHKSDVYSFGIIILEIVSGRRNSGFQSDLEEDLIKYAWRHWKNGTPLEIMDPNLLDSFRQDEVNKCIHIGLLCVQEDAADRPTIASIQLMLANLPTSLPQIQATKTSSPTRELGVPPSK